MHKIKINLKEIEIKDLNGLLYPQEDLPKNIGNIIFTKATTIEVSDIARTLHAGKEIEVDQKELEEISFITAGNAYYVPFAHVQVVQYFNNKLIELNKLKEETPNGKHTKNNDKNN